MQHIEIVGHVTLVHLPVQIYRDETNGGAKGNVLAQLIMAAISCLHSKGAIVSTCVCDGYSTNKSAMIQFGISGKPNSPYEITHPMDENRKVKFTIDAPHLVKCTRNHVLNNKKTELW